MPSFEYLYVQSTSCDVMHMLLTIFKTALWMEHWDLGYRRSPMLRPPICLYHLCLVLEFHLKPNSNLQFSFLLPKSCSNLVFWVFISFSTYLNPNALFYQPNFCLPHLGIHCHTWPFSVVIFSVFPLSRHRLSSLFIRSLEPNSSLIL